MSSSSGALVTYRIFPRTTVHCKHQKALFPSSNVVCKQVLLPSLCESKRPCSRGPCNGHRLSFSTNAVVIPPPHTTVLLNLRSSRLLRCFCSRELTDEEKGSENVVQKDNDTKLSLGVTVALAMLHFYRREISPFLPSSCRFVPSCSEYSMQAYRKYGVAKGTILTAWRLLRCNPLGPSGFDPPRWFGENEQPT